MPSPTDPIRVWRGRTQMTLAIGVACVIVTGLWAVRTPSLDQSPYHPTHEIQSRSERMESDARLAIDAEAFDVVLWHEPKQLTTPPPSTPVVARKAPDPLAAIAAGYEIVAIVQSQPMAAVIYDKKRDELQRVAVGFSIASDAEVTAIEHDGVVISLGERTLRMAMPTAVRVAEAFRKASP
mgnify:CR=1 FL=1